MNPWRYFPSSQGPYGTGTGLCGGWQITSYFGGRIDPLTGLPGSHGGEDLAFGGCGGTPIFAPIDGTLSQGWDPSGGGNWSGITGDDYCYIGIGHAASFAPGAPYRRVSAGEVIAYVDSTGGSTGDHMHVCYREPGDGYYSDPYDLLMECSGRFADGPPDDINDSEVAMQPKFATDESTGALYLVWFTEGLPFRKQWLSTDAQVSYWSGFGFEDLGAQGFMLGCVADLGTPLPH